MIFVRKFIGSSARSTGNTMTNEEFVRISRFLKSKYGIDMSHKKTIMQGRLDNFVRMQGFKSYNQFMDAMQTDITGNLEKKLVDLLSTNHTYFMRETEHFDYMKSTVLPWLKQKEALKKDLHIWCAASSSGEEPYTLAMIIMDFFGLEHKDWDTQILATDISNDILRKAVEGRYSSEQIEPLPENWKRRYFKAVNGTEDYVVTNELKSEVMFRKLNLMDTFPFKKPLHVVFMRNVLIYFDAPTKQKVIKKVYDSLVPGGYLFIGKTETLDRDVVPFKLVGPAIYRK